MIRILVDADACPVKEEVYRVAFRREVPVIVVPGGEHFFHRKLHVIRDVVGRLVRPG